MPDKMNRRAGGGSAADRRQSVRLLAFDCKTEPSAGIARRGVFAAGVLPYRFFLYFCQIIAGKMKGIAFVIVLIAIVLHTTLTCSESCRTLCPPVLTQQSGFVLAADSTLGTSGETSGTSFADFLSCAVSVLTVRFLHAFVDFRPCADALIGRVYRAYVVQTEDALREGDTLSELNRLNI